MQSLGYNQAESLVSYAFSSPSNFNDINCESVYDSYLVFQELVNTFSKTWSEEADQNCFHMDSIDGAYQVQESGLLQCQEIASGENYNTCQNTLDEFFEQNITSLSLAGLRLQIFALPDTGDCLKRFRKKLNQIADAGD